MKLKFTFELIAVGDTVTAVPISDKKDAFHGVLNLNDTGIFILNLLKDDTTPDKLVADILEEYDGNEEDIRRYVEVFLNTLRENGLLIED